MLETTETLDTKISKKTPTRLCINTLKYRLKFQVVGSNSRSSSKINIGTRVQRIIHQRVYHIYTTYRKPPIYESAYA